jgi:molybdopterin-guanine dinucleotide biosynthesis protein A
MNFSAVILAGGKSSRMGRDKAFLEIGGQTLLTRQIHLVREIGAAEIFISGRTGTDYSAFSCRVLPDKFPDAGPLAGIERALEAISSPMLLALAVDLPDMRAEFLRALAARCPENSGAVPRVHGHLEPLAAFYPKASLPLAVSLLNENSNAVKHFAERCAQAALVNFVDVADDESRFFQNCNSPADLAAIGKS